jgi:hypothetical protein
MRIDFNNRLITCYLWKGRYAPSELFMPFAQRKEGNVLVVAYAYYKKADSIWIFQPKQMAVAYARNGNVFADGGIQKLLPSKDFDQLPTKEMFLNLMEKNKLNVEGFDMIFKFRNGR